MCGIDFDILLKRKVNTTQMFQDLTTAIPLGFFLAFLIGPAFFVLIETAVVKGVRAAIALDIGVILGDVLFIGIAYLSSYQLLENLSNLPGLYVLGGVILVGYGLAILLKKPSRNTIDPNRVKFNKYGYAGLFAKGFFLNAINIGVLAFWLAVTIIVGPSLENDGNRILGFFVTLVGAYFITDLGKILLAKQLKRYLTPRRIFNLKRVLGVLLIVSGLSLATKGFLPNDTVNIQKGIEKLQDRT